MEPQSVLITGASQGIGLEFVRQFLTSPKPPKYLFATCIKADTSKALKELQQRHCNLRVLKLDVRATETFPALYKEVSSLVGDAGLNLLINVAGINWKQNDCHRLESDALTKDVLMAHYETNAVGPLFLSKALLPLLRKASTYNSGMPMGCSKAAIVSVSSNLGSMEDNKIGGELCGGEFAYRASKAALNMIARSLCVDLAPDDILVNVVHPGWVKTEMGGPGAKITREESVTGLMNVMGKMDKSYNGGFFKYTGETLPW